MSDNLNALADRCEGARLAFDLWIDALTEDVIEREYGYEPGEFAVFPDQWHAMWKEGLTPQQAFRRALDAFAEQRTSDDREQKEKWDRIQAEDAAFRSRSTRSSSDAE